MMFAQNVSERDNHTLDEDVKMYFLVETTAMDAFIACWESKMYYDYARRILLFMIIIRKDDKSMGRSGKGIVQMRGEEWRPYSPETFLCPPFPSYVSGHSTISGACADALRFFTGSDNFGLEVRLVPGAMTEPDNVGDRLP